mmetsp:Transcript_18441/g.44405  ORF Transcript_18441/g.44405 Transcript_18441/m.44405 type:complete len:91 (+) Transcript_18441:767-1039(+)
MPAGGLANPQRILQQKYRVPKGMEEGMKCETNHETSNTSSLNISTSTHVHQRTCEGGEGEAYHTGHTPSINGMVNILFGKNVHSSGGCID